MSYRVKNIKDDELPTLLYLLEEILDSVFDKYYNDISDDEWKEFINNADSVESDLKPVSLKTVKNFYELLDGDNSYRPRYKNIEFLIYALCKKKISFQGFQTLHQEDINAYFGRLQYDIYEVNPSRKEATTHKKGLQKYNFGEASLQIDLSDVFVTKVLSSIKPIVGDMLSRKFEEETKLPSFHYDQRINTRLAIKETLRQKNIDTIIAKALRFPKTENPSHEDVDLDWMSHFFDSAQDTSNEDMQYIWAKILANEVDEPNSFSRRTINTIKIIDPEEAQLFTLLCNCLWELLPEDTMFDRVLFKNSTNEGKFSDASWGFNEESLKHLVDIGLIHETYIILEKDIEYDVMYRGNKHILCTNNNAIEVEVVRLSNIGSEIFDVVMTEPNMEYYKHTLNFFKQEKFFKK